MPSIDRFQDQALLSAQLKRIYDDYRTGLFKRKYYAHRLTTYKNWNLVFEGVLALGTSGTIATWAIWKTGIGEYAWTFVAAFVAVLAVLKPILQLPKAIERYSQLYIGWSDLYYDLDELVLEIQTSRTFNQDMHKLFSTAIGRRKKLNLDEDPELIEKLKQKYTDEVNKEILPTSLWIPTG